jgi:hypothetical protein
MMMLSIVWRTNAHIMAVRASNGHSNRHSLAEGSHTAFHSALASGSRD